MPWQNLTDYDPGTVFNVYRNGVLVPPANYAALGISVDVTAGRAVLTYPLEPFTAIWDLEAEPSAPVALQLRLFEAEADPGTDAPERIAYGFIAHVNPDDNPESPPTLNGPVDTVTFPIQPSAALALGVGIQREAPV